MEAAKSLNKLKLENVSLSVDQRSLTKILLKEGVFYRNTLNAIASLKEMLHTSDVTEVEDDAEVELIIARENLLDLLLLQLDQSLECMFKLFSLKYDQADIDTAYFGLKSEQYDVRVNSVEFLDNLLMSRLKTNILPLIEYQALSDSDISTSSFQTKILAEKEMLTMLGRNRGSRMKMAVLHVIRATGNTDFISVVKALEKGSSAPVKRIAKKATKELQNLTITD